MRGIWGRETGYRLVSRSASTRSGKAVLVLHAADKQDFADQSVGGGLVTLSGLHHGAYSVKKCRELSPRSGRIPRLMVEKRLTLFFRSNINIQLKEIAQHVAHEPGFSSEYWIIQKGNAIGDCAPIEDTPTVGPFPVNHLRYPIYVVN